MNKLNIIICKIFGHKWQILEYNRVCQRCGHEQTVWSRRFPKIGEAQTFWDDSPRQRMKNAKKLK